METAGWMRPIHLPLRGDKKQMELTPNAVLRGPFWDEPMRVLTAQPLNGEWAKIEAVGLHSRRYAAQILGPAELAQVQIGERSAPDFAGDATAAFFTSPDYPFLESEGVLKGAIADGVRQRFFGLKVAEQTYFDEGIASALASNEAQVVSKEIAEQWKKEQERREQERKERACEGYEPPKREKKPLELDEPGEETELPRPEGHRVKIVARVPWDKLSEFVSGVLLPLQSAGAEIGLKVELTAHSQQPIGSGVLDLKVRETLQQIGADTESFEVQ